MIIIGKGGMARELYSYIHNNVEYMLTSDELKKCDPSLRELNAIVAIGDGAVRERIVKENPDLHWANVNLGTRYGDNDIGDGTIVCPGSYINTNVWIGRHCIINVNCLVHHDAVIYDYSTLSPGAIICGNVELGINCFVGAGAVIREKIKVCNDVIIGAGAVVVKDITEPGTYVGNPAKKIK